MYLKMHPYYTLTFTHTQTQKYIKEKKMSANPCITNGKFLCCIKLCFYLKAIMKQMFKKELFNIAFSSFSKVL